jgi:GNAT superfamily N-acetyltransferase
MQANVSIRIADEADVGLLARIIRNSHADVARRFKLTPANCPKHPSNCAAEWIEVDLTRGVRYYLADWHGEPAGCVALEHANPEMVYLERLSVLPEKRRNGLGQRLVESVFQETGALSVSMVGIGIISDFTELKEWYKKLGFRAGETKTFEHLPFKVLLMAYHLP